MFAVEAENIKKVYQKTTALDNVSFQIRYNEIFGFIGPDGAGKTSLFRILTTLLLPDSGQVRILESDLVRDFKSLRKRIGYMPGKFSLYYDLTVEENLSFFSSIFGTTVKENYHLIKNIYSQIEPFKKRIAGNLSGGMKQKLALSCALIHKPEILILDEPTTGVDAVSRKEFWEMLIDLQKQGITIIVSTPYMDEANLCNKVALIQQGKILKIDKPDEITKSFDKKIYAIKSDSRYEMVSSLKNYRNCYSVYPFGEFFHYIDKSQSVNFDALSEYMHLCGINDFQISETQADIEDCFIELMKDKDWKM